MARVSLRLLGGFELRIAGRPTALPARKGQALLAYLALRPRQSHPRETLTALLWGDTPEHRARQSLRQTLVGLRRVLRARRAAVLITHGDMVTLDAADLDIDVARFGRLARRGTAKALEAAAALYRGPLLDGLQVAETGFDDWLQSERARLHERVVDVLRALVGHHARRGGAEAAADTAARLLALDPLQEDVHRTLIRLYARQGRRRGLPPRGWAPRRWGRWPTRR